MDLFQNIPSEFGTKTHSGSKIWLPKLFVLITLIIIKPWQEDFTLNKKLGITINKAFSGSHIQGGWEDLSLSLSTSKSFIHLTKNQTLTLMTANHVGPLTIINQMKLQRHTSSLVSSGDSIAAKRLE